MQDWMTKLTHSKCPHCKQHGIRSFGKIGYKTNPVVTCKHCGKQFRVNWALSFLGKILIPSFIGFCGLFLKSVGLPLWFWCVLAAVGFGLFEYIVPLEVVDPPETRDGS